MDRLIPRGRLARGLISFGLAAGLALALVMAIRTGADTSRQPSPGVSAAIPTQSPQVPSAPSRSSPASPTPRYAEGTQRPLASPAATVSVRASRLLSTSYVAAAFGSGKRAAVLEQPGYVMGTCFTWSSWHQNEEPRNLPPGAREIRTEPTQVVGRRWSWPNEVALVQAIGLEPGVPSARRRFQACTDAKSPDFDPDNRLHRDRPTITTRALPLGDEAAVTTVRSTYQTVSYATVRVGRHVITLAQRQSGRIASDVPLAQALESALKKARGLREGAVPEASRPDVPAALAGLLSTAALPLVHGERGVMWSYDAPLWWSQGKSTLYCLGGSAGDTTLTTTAVPVERRWIWPSRTFDDPVEVAFTLVVAEAPDEQTARQEFGACRDRATAGTEDYEIRDLPDLGDQAYVWVRKFAHSGYSATPVLVRSGTRYLIVWAHGLGSQGTPNPEGAEAVARAALAALVGSSG